MKAKQLAARVDILSTKLFREEDRIEKLGLQVDDYLAACEELEAPTVEGTHALKTACEQLKALSWKLSGMAGDLQEVACELGETVDLIGEAGAP